METEPDLAGISENGKSERKPDPVLAEMREPRKRIRTKPAPDGNADRKSVGRTESSAVMHGK